MEIPVSGAKITELDKALLHRVVNSGWYTDGEYHSLFRRELAKATGTRHVTLCNSGSSALLLAINACSEYYESKKHGKRYVVTCATGFPTTVTPIIQAGFTPYFVDVDRKTLQINTNTALEILDNREVAGIMVAHTLGFPFDAEAINKGGYGDQFFINDCSDALGAYIGDTPVGSFGDVSTYSFFPAHHITMGEGGAVATKLGKMRMILESYNNWGRDCWCKPGESDTCNKRFGHKMGKLPDGYDHKYIFSRIGYNFKMTEFQAALGYSQIQRLKEIVQKRRENFASIYRILSEYDTIDLIDWSDNAVPSPFGFPIIVNEKAKFTAKDMVQYLETNGIRTRPIFGGNLIRQPFMQEVPYIVAVDVRNSDYLMRNAFWIGCHDALTEEQLMYILKKLLYFFGSKE